MEIKDIIELAVLLIIFIIFIIWLILIVHSIKLSSRINKHIIKQNDDDNISLIDKLVAWYDLRKKELVDDILKTNRTKQVDKKKQFKETANIVDSIFSGILFVVFYIILSMFYLNKITIFSTIFAFFLGFLLPGIIFLVKDVYRRNSIEKELVKVITLINNNLQANKSIKEALIDTESKIDNDLKKELKEVINDLDHGLSLEIAFKRMKDRCEVEDIIYLSTTLSILSKTGGNTKEVFNYLENLFQTRNRLKQEFDSTIASAKLVYIILAILPIVVFIGMLLIYNNYLVLFLDSPLGNLLGFSILLLYLIYIIIVRKIMIIDKY